jgi:nucleoside-diphosphate-sugar epimerase
MKIFLTGGTGFIGSHFLNQALAAGHQVRCLRRSSQSKPRIKLREEPEWLGLPLDKIEPRHLEGADVVVHLAASGMPPQASSWEGCMKTNFCDQNQLLNASNEAGISNIIIAGSYSEYGTSALRYDLIPCDAPLEPVGCYATSKACACVAAVSYCREKHIRLSYLRIFSAFGDGQFEKNFWPSMRKAAFAGEDFPLTLGEQIRDFIPVEDVAARFLAEATHLSTLDPELPTHIRIANVGTGRPQSLRQFAEYWWNHWKAKGQLVFGAVPYRKDEVMRYVPDLEVKEL